MKPPASTLAVSFAWLFPSLDFTARNARAARSIGRGVPQPADIGDDLRKGELKITIALHCKNVAFRSQEALILNPSAEKMPNSANYLGIPP
jgi:hypothetical protein